MSQHTNPNGAATRPVVASNLLLGFGLHMPPGSVQIVAVDDDSEIWADVPIDSMLIEKTTLNVRRSQYAALVEAMRKQSA